MIPRKTASTAALIGGLGWLVTVGLVAINGGADTGEGLIGVMYVVGLVALVVALAASGYALAATAPIWLRAVVSVALPVLVVMVWQVADDAILATSANDGWLHGELSILLAALIAAAMGARGLHVRKPGGRRAGAWTPGRERATDPSPGSHVAR